MSGPHASSPPPVIEIIVNTDGSTSVETHGYVGRSCREASAFLEKALGTVANERLTADFYQQQESVRQHESG